MSKPYSVYCIRFEDESEYFGVTSQDLAMRIYQHTKCSHNKKVAERMKAGMDFEVSLMASGLPKSEAQELEKGYIQSGSHVLNDAHTGYKARKAPSEYYQKKQINVAFDDPVRKYIQWVAAQEKRSEASVVRQYVEIGIGEAKRIRATMGLPVGPDEGTNQEEST